MTERSQKEMVLQDTLFFLTPMDTKKHSILGQSKSSPLSQFTRSSKVGTMNSIKTRVRHKRILGLCNEVRKKGEVTGSPTPRMTNTKGEALQLTNPFGRCKSKQKGHLPGEMFVRSQHMRLKRKPRQIPDNQRKIPIRWQKLAQRTELRKTRYILKTTVLEARSMPVKEQTCLRAARYPLTARGHGASTERIQLPVKQKPSKEWYPIDNTNEGTRTTLTSRGQLWRA